MKRFISLTLITLMLVTSFGCAAQSGNGAAVGAAVGGAAGALAFKNKMLGAAIGAGAGAFLGWIVGIEMTNADQRKINKALENQQSGVAMQWQNQDTGKSFQVIPQNTYQTNNGVLTRDILINTSDGEKMYVKAVRGQDGVWQLIQ